MKNKLSKIMLMITTIPLVFATISFAAINKSDYKIVDIKGSRNELEDINIISQQKEGLYNTSEVILTKDSVKEKNYTKQVPQEIKPTKYTKENRDILDGQVSDENEVYKDKESIGTVFVEMDYGNYTNEFYSPRLEARVKDKNLKTNKVQTYKIPLQLDRTFQGNLSYGSIATKNNGEIYLVVALEIDKDSDSKITSKEESYINVYKLNLQNQKSEVVTTKEISKQPDPYTLGTALSFINKDDIYIEKSIYEKDSKKDKVKKSTLIKYNIKDDYFEEIDIPKNLIFTNFDSVKCEVEDDKVFITSSAYNRKEGKVEINIDTINLKTNKLLENKKFSIDIKNKSLKNNKELLYQVFDNRVLNNKRYILINEVKEDGDGRYYSSRTKNFIYVLDEKSGDILYNGEITSQDTINPYIVTKEEL